VQGEFEAALAASTAAAAEIAAASNPPPMPLKRLPRTWQLPAPPAAATWTGSEDVIEVSEEPPRVEFEWASEVIRHVGTVVHRALQQIGREGLERWDAERVAGLGGALARALAELGVPPARIEPAAGRVAAALTRSLTDERGRWILDSRHRDAQCEYALSGVVQGELVSVVLDRTFVDEHGVRWIIDYKTGAHEGADLDAFLDRERNRYAPQIERYATLMARLDNRPIRLGLYFPLLGGWREWQPEGRGA